MVSPLLLRTIDTELRWRETELALLKAQLRRDTADDVHFRYSYRCFAAITYAHYEAFVKTVAAQVLIDIRASGVKPSECCESIRISLIAAPLRKSLVELPKKELIEAIHMGVNYVDTISLPSEQQFFEISNLNIRNLESLLSSVGISPLVIVPYKPSIGRLVDLRHQCAHGERVSFDSTQTNAELADEMFTTQARIVELMHLIAMEAIDVFERGRFRREPPPT